MTTCQFLEVSVHLFVDETLEKLLEGSAAVMLEIVVAAASTAAAECVFD